MSRCRHVAPPNMLRHTNSACDPSSLRRRHYAVDPCNSSALKHLFHQSRTCDRPDVAVLLLTPSRPENETAYP
jgi:hypothetical protein